MIWSNLFGNVSSSLWFIFTMNGIRCAYSPRHRAEHAERRGDRVAATLDRELDDVRGIEVLRVRRERRGRRVLDALVDGEDRHVPAAAEAPVAVELLQVAQHLHRPVAPRPHPVDEVGTRQVEVVLGNALTGVIQQRVGVVAEQGVDVHPGIVRDVSRRPTHEAG